MHATTTDDQPDLGFQPAGCGETWQSTLMATNHDVTASSVEACIGQVFRQQARKEQLDLQRPGPWRGGRKALPWM